MQKEGIGTFVGLSESNQKFVFQMNTIPENRP